VAKQWPSGRATILYSNSLLRAYAALSDTYAASYRYEPAHVTFFGAETHLHHSVPTRLGGLRTHRLPTLINELYNTISSLQGPSDIPPWLKAVTDQWENDVKDVKAKVEACFHLHQVLVSCSDLLARAKLPNELAVFGKNVQDFVVQIKDLKDYTSLPDNITTRFEALQQPLQAWIDLKASSTAESRKLALQYLRAELKETDAAITPAKAAISDAQTPLGAAIERAYSNFRAELTKCEQASTCKKIQRSGDAITNWYSISNV
jgi:hypothetical protein